MQHCEHLFLGQNQYNFDIGINYNLQAKVKKISKPFFLENGNILNNFNTCNSNQYTIT